MKEGLHRVAELVRTMEAQAAAVTAAAAALAEAQRAYRFTETEALPELMRELGVEALRLEDGTKVSVSEAVNASITEAHRAAAHRWLRDHNFGGLIKTEVTMEFGRGEEVEARAIAEEVAQRYARTAEMTEKVHPSTLRAFVQEQMRAGVAVPFDLFSVQPFSRAKIEVPKAK